MKRFPLTLISMLLLWFAAPLAQASTYYVATTGNDSNPGTQAQPFRTIAKGITAGANGDTILVADGTYNENSLSIRFTYQLTLQSQSGNPAACIVNGHRRDILTISFASVFVAGFTFRDAFSSDGGAVLLFTCDATLSNCIFANNEAGVRGGGVAILYDAHVTLSQCRFTNNLADRYGGGLFSDASCHVEATRCTFSGNICFPFFPLDGGVGGGADFDSSGSVTNCIFRENTCQGPGSIGGGLSVRNSTTLVTNCLFYNNHSDGPGGAIYTYHSPITNCTVTGNDSGEDPYGSGERGAICGKTGGLPTTCVNCISWDNGGGNAGGNIAFTYSDIQDGFPGIGNMDADPKFVNPATGNYRLKTDSPCLNRGSATTPTLPANDLDDGLRILGSAPEMGAYELWLFSSGTWYVDKSRGNDIFGFGSPYSPFATVSRAITVASNGHRIYIKQGNYGTDKPRITKALRLFNWGNTGLSRVGQP